MWVKISTCRISPRVCHPKALSARGVLWSLGGGIETLTALENSERILDKLKILGRLYQITYYWLSTIGRYIPRLTQLMNLFSWRVLYQGDIGMTMEWVGAGRARRAGRGGDYTSHPHPWSYNSLYPPHSLRGLKFNNHPYPHGEFISSRGLIFCDFF